MKGLEQAKYQAKRSLKSRLGEKETLNPAIIAKAGNGAGTAIVPGRSGWAYVRLHGDDNQLTEAKVGIPVNVAELNDAWVRVRRASGRKMSYYVIEEFISSGEGDPTPPLQAHALDPDDGPHTGTLDYTHVVNKEHGASHHEFGDDELDVKDLADSEGRLLTGAQKTDLTDGGTTTLHQHAGGTTSSVEITLTNRTGGQRTAGDVVVTDPSNDESFIGTTVVGYQGKVLVVAETIADLTGGLCWERGGPFDVKVTGAVDRNDGLRTSATIYRAEAAPSLTGGGVFAVALSPNISGEGTVKAVFLDAIGAGGGGGNGNGEYPPSWKFDLDEPKESSDTPDDEFDQGASGLDGKWTAVSGASGTVDLLETGNVGKYDLTTREGILYLQVGSTIGQAVLLRQDYTLPDGKSIIAAVYPTLLFDGTPGIVNNELWFGIGLNDNDGDFEAGTWDAMFMDADADGARIIHFGTALASGGIQGASITPIAGLGGRIYFRMHRDGTMYYGFVSFDGIVWIPVGRQDNSTVYTNIWIFCECRADFGDPVPIQAVDWIRLGGQGVIPW